MVNVVKYIRLSEKQKPDINKKEERVEHIMTLMDAVETYDEHERNLIIEQVNERLSWRKWN
jgi:hypothetical protein